MGCTECTYPILFKVTVNVSCTPNKFVSVKNSVFLGIKKPKTLGLSKQKEQGISTSWFAFCLCSRPLYLKLYSGTRVSRKYHLCHICHFTVKGIVSWGTKHFGCANSHHCLSHYPLRMCGSRDAMLHCVMLVCCAVPNSVFGILWSIYYIFTLCGKLCSAAWSNYLQEKSFYSESKSNLSEWWREKQWVKSITSLSPTFHTGNDSLCAQILSVSQLRSYELKTHWLQGLDPLGFSSLLQLNTSAFKNLFWLL